MRNTHSSSVYGGEVAVGVGWDVGAGGSSSLMASFSFLKFLEIQHCCVRTWISLVFNLAEFFSNFWTCLLQNLGQFSAAIFWKLFSLSPFLQSMLFFNNTNYCIWVQHSRSHRCFPHPFSTLLFKSCYLYWGILTFTDLSAALFTLLLREWYPVSFGMVVIVLFSSKFPFSFSFCLFFSLQKLFKIRFWSRNKICLLKHFEGVTAETSAT